MEKSYMCNAAETSIATDSEPRLTLQAEVDETMSILKELLLMMNDTNVGLFGSPFKPMDEKLPEPDCLNNAVIIVHLQARTALIQFCDMRKRML